ncbi:MAG: hypothetical protein IKH11_04780 [Bacteroidales bacterium]|nr:hypothetical protein [Bacteroidales bacterium]
MKFITNLFITLFVVNSITGCTGILTDAYWYNIDGISQNAISIKTVGEKDNVIIYSIGSVLEGAGTSNPDIGSFYRCHFCQEKYNKEFNLKNLKPIIEVQGCKYNGVQYSKPGQFIESIILMNIDESFSLGSSIAISLNQGKYNGANPLVKDVRINSYKTSYTKGGNNDYADISIAILLNNKRVIYIMFSNDFTYPDNLT